MTLESARRRSSLDGPAGFTLIEVMAALAVVALVLGTLALSVRFGMAASRTVGRVSESAAALESTDAVLRRLIEGVDPGGGIGFAPFVGGANSFECLTAMPDQGRLPAHRMWARVFVDNAHRLVVRWRPYLRAVRLGPRPPVREVVLLANVDSIALDFWNPDSGWVRAWPASQPPVLVRIRLVFPSGDARQWPEIVAAPLLDPA
jgi:general secretion pathway protein J